MSAPRKTVRETLPSHGPIVALGSESVRAAARRMADENVPALAVLEDRRVVGVFTERDVTTKVVAAGLDPDAVRIGDVMARESLPVATLEEPYDVAVRRMKRAGRRNILVVDGDRLAGIAALPDLVELGLSEKSEEVEMLESYVYYYPPSLTAEEARPPATPSPLGTRGEARR